MKWLNNQVKMRIVQLSFAIWYRRKPNDPVKGKKQPCKPKITQFDTEENELQVQKYTTNVCAGWQTLAMYDVTLEASPLSKNSTKIAKGSIFK